MRKSTIGLAALLVALLSLVWTTSAFADPPFPDYVVTAQPGDTVTYDVAVQNPSLGVTQVLFVMSGNCFSSGPTSVVYTETNTTPGFTEVCKVAVNYSGGFGVADFIITVGSPPPPPNTAPTAAFTATGGELSASFDASASSDPDSGDSIVSYQWDFGDSSSGVGVTTSHSYVTAGTYSVTLTVTDSHGATNSTSHDVTVTAPPPPPVGPVLIYVSDPVVREVDPGQGVVSADFQVTLSRSTNVPVKIDYTTIPWTANLSDFVMTWGTRTINPGETTTTISVAIKADNRREASEVFKLLYFSCDASKAQVAEPILPGVNVGVADATIIDDDH